MKHKFYNFTRRGDVAELLIFGAIGYDVNAKSVVNEILAAQAAGVQKLNIFIDSPGGSVFDGLAIYNAIRMMNATVYIYGHAASMASVIAMAGKKTIMAPHSYMMIHNPWTFTVGEQKDLEKDVDLLAQIKDTIMSAYQNKTKKSKEEIGLLMDDETWMTGEKALELGFVDEVRDPAEAMNGGIRTFANMVADALSDKFRVKFQNFPKKTEEKTMLTKEALQALGLADDATDEQISAAILANPKSDPEPDPKPDPEPVVDEVKSLVLDIAKKVDKLEQQIVDDAQNKIVDTVDAAIAAYKIKASEKDIWIAALEKDYDSAKEKLDAIEANTVKPQSTKIDDKNNGELTFKSGTMSLIEAAAQEFKTHGRK